MANKMAKAKRLKPRSKWTDRLAWAVWKKMQNNKLRAAKGLLCPLTFEGDPLTFGGDKLEF